MINNRDLKLGTPSEIRDLLCTTFIGWLPIRLGQEYAGYCPLFLGGTATPVKLSQQQDWWIHGERRYCTSAKISMYLRPYKLSDRGMVSNSDLL
jgi:hypothetical protein